MVENSTRKSYQVLWLKIVPGRAVKFYGLKYYQEGSYQVLWLKIVP